MTSSPVVPGPSEDKENHPPVEVIDLTGDSEDEEEVPDLAEDSGCLIPLRKGKTSGLFLCRLLLPRGIRTPLQRVSNAYVHQVPSDPVLLLTPSLKSCEGSGTSPIRALDIGFRGAVDHFEPLPEYTPLALGQSHILRAPTPASASQVIGRRLHQVHEGLMHLQRCRELFAAACAEWTTWCMTRRVIGFS